jgi:hypothetical protein
MMTFADTGFLASLYLEAKIFFSFDERQRKAAASEGLKVKP